MPRPVLYHKATGERVKIGDTIHNADGEPGVVVSWEEPAHSGKSGRVRVRAEWALFGEFAYYAGVSGCEFRWE